MWFGWLFMCKYMYMYVADAQFTVHMQDGTCELARGMIHMSTLVEAQFQARNRKWLSIRIVLAGRQRTCNIAESPAMPLCVGTCTWLTCIK